MKKLLLFILLSPFSLFATNYYISTTGNNTNNGLSTATPKATVANVFSTYNLGAGDTIFIAAGTYAEKNITIGSDDEGFTIQGAELDASDQPTTIFDSDQTATWLTFNSDNNDNITIDKIKIKDYKSNLSTPDGGGICINSKDCLGITITNCYFDNCDAGSGARGGAIFFFILNGSSNTFNLLNNTFTNCDVSNGGGAVYINSSTEFDLNISSCKFFNNSSSLGSGSVLYYDCNTTSVLNMTNCLVYGNTLSGNNHGTIYVGNGGCKANLINSTIANNSAPSTYTGGVFFDANAGGSTLTNCIIYNNTYKDVYRLSGIINLKNCCYKTHFNCTPDINSFTTDPGFKNAASNDYSLATTSSCIDKGTATGAPSDDILSAPRPMGLGYDIGAYESSSCSVNSASSTPTVCINSPITNITHTTTGATGIGAATGLPTGLSATFTGNATAGTITISGTPTVDGTFNYNIPLTVGCGTFNATGTITVNPYNTVTGPESTTLCINTTLSPITHTTTGVIGIASTTTNYGLPTGVSASFNSGTGTISIIGTPTVSTGSPFNYTIPLTGGCGTVNATGTITVNPDNTVTGSESATLCINTALSPITHTTTGATGIGAATGLPTGLTATFTGNATAGTITISGTPSIDGTFNYSIPLTGGCGSVNATGTLTVNSLDNASFTYSSNSFCIGVDPNPVANITGKQGGVFTISPSGAIFNANTGVVTLSSSNTGVYSVTYTSNGICPNSQSTNISIGSGPSVNSISNQTICQGANFNSINFTGTPGTVFQWTNSNIAIGLASSGNGNIASFMGSGATSSSPNVSSTITVTPKIGSCLGAPKSFTLTVKYKDEASISYSDASYCTSNSNPTPTITGVQGGIFSSTPSGLVLNSSTGLVDINASSEGVYEVKYQTSSGCGASATTSLGISNNPLVNNIPDQSICSGISFTDIIFTGTPGTEYQWTNSNTAIGLASSGTGNIPSFVALGSTIGGNNINAIITVTPKVGTCIGSSKTFLLTVKPLDNASFSYSSSSFCLTESNPTPTITGITGGSFSSFPVGLSINTSGSINLNSSSAGTYEVKYTTNGQCPNVSTFPISIGSNPSVNPVLDQTICQGANFNSINFTGTPGTVFQWTNSNPAIGVPASGTGDLSSFIGVNTGNATITVTPRVGSCIGASQSFKLNVNSPTSPTFTQLGPYCKDATADAFQTTSTNGIAGTWNATISTATVGTQTYTFTPTSTSAPTCAMTKTMDIEVKDVTIPTFTQLGPYCKDATADALQLTSNNAIAGTWNAMISTASLGTQTYTFTPTSSSVPTCATTSTMTVTVNTSTSASPISGNTDICQGSTSQLTNATPGGVWSSSNTAVATINSSGLVTAVSEGFSTIKYDVTGNSACSQSAEKPFRVIGLPVVNDVPDQQVCEGASFNPINFSGTAGATFNWSNSDTKIGLNANGSGNINAFIAKGTTLGGSAFTSYITVTPVIGNCIGNIYILKLSVSPQENAAFSYNDDLFCKNQPDPIPTILGTKGGVFSANPSGLVINPADGTISLNSSSAGTYSIMYKTTGKCSNTLSLVFQIKPIPTVDTIPDHTICSGYFADSIKFKGSAGASFDWTNSNPNTGLMSNGVNIIRSFNAINNSATNQISVVSVTPKSGKCLGATKKFNIIVRSTPQLVVTQVDTIVCPGGNINFKTQLTPAISNATYQWYTNDIKVGANSSIYWSNTLKNKDKISVNVTGKDFCPSSANLFVRMDSLRLSIQAPSMIYLKDPAINLVGYPVGGTFSGKGVANNKLDPSVVGVGNKMITYSFKNANNCSGQLTQKVVVYDTVPNNCHSITYDTITDTVAVLKFKFKLTTGIKANQETSMRVFPNPTSDILVVEAADEKALAGYRYKLMDAAGKEVYNQPVKSTITEISLKSLGAAGTYFFEVFDEKQQRLVSKKIILD